MNKFALMLLVAAALTACDRDQSMAAGSTNRADTPPWQGAKNSYVVGGWTAGDKASWESQMRKRSIDQNEYAKAN